MQPNFIWQRLIIKIQNCLKVFITKMKKLYIFLFLVSLLSSCDNIKDLQPQQQAANDIVPKIVIDAVKQEFPEATEMKFLVVEKSKIWESEFKVKVNKMSAIINHLGQITESYQITTDVELPENAKTYISTNYPNATIKTVSQQIGKDQKILGYKVFLLTKDNKEVTLIFDATGTLSILIDNDKTTPVKPNVVVKTYLIAQKDLPEAIKTLLVQKHGDYRFIQAAVTTEGLTKTYNVVVSKDLTVFEYVFDEKGTILKSSSVSLSPTKVEEKTLLEKDLPAVIKTLLDKDFKGWVWQKGVVSSKDGKVQGYQILVKVGNKTYSLQFDANGKLLGKQEIGDNNGSQSIKLIEEKDLPKIIVDLLKTKHKDYKYAQISLVTEKEKKTYWVTIAIENTIFDYTFDEKGNVLSSSSFTKPIIEEKDLLAQDIPSKIKDYLDKKYVGWLFQKAKITYVNNKIESYLIAIKAGNDIYYVTFDEKENFIAVRKG
jgi:hypothetical protein